VDSLSVDKKHDGRLEPAAESAFMVLRQQGNVKLDKGCAKKVEGKRSSENGIRIFRRPVVVFTPLQTTLKMTPCHDKTLQSACNLVPAMI